MTVDEPLVLALSGTAGPDGVAALCQQVAELVAGSGTGVVVCDVGGLSGHTIAAVDALARLHLTVTRLGRRIRFRRVPRELQELLALSGLGQVLSVAADDGSPQRRSPA